MKSSTLSRIQFFIVYSNSHPTTTYQAISIEDAFQQFKKECCNRITFLQAPYRFQIGNQALVILPAVWKSYHELSHISWNRVCFITPQEEFQETPFLIELVKDRMVKRWFQPRHKILLWFLHFGWAEWKRQNSLQKKTTWDWVRWGFNTYRNIFKAAKQAI